MEEIIVGLDIGSHMIHLAVGQFDVEGNLQIIGGVDHLTQGISKGRVVSIEDLIASISKTLEKAERVIGRPVSDAYLGVSGLNVKSQTSQGVVAVTRAGNEIATDDVARALDAAKTVVTPVNYEIIHNVPINYIVDDQSGIKDPVGMTGNKLEIKTLVFQAFATYVNNLNKATFRAGIDVGELVYNGLATPEAVLDQRQKELGVALVDIGANSTTVTVYEEGNLLLSESLPIGSAYITNDIALGMRVSVDLAEKLKLFYGTALPSEVDKKEEINLAEIDDQETESVMKKELANIIEARVEEIFKMVDEKLQTIDRSGKLPAGAVLVGGGAKLQGMIEIAKQQFRLPVSAGVPKRVSSVIDKVNDPSFMTAVGLVLWGAEDFSLSPGIFTRFAKLPSKAIGGVKKIFKSFK